MSTSWRIFASVLLQLAGRESALGTATRQSASRACVPWRAEKVARARVGTSCRGKQKQATRQRGATVTTPSTAETTVKENGHRTVRNSGVTHCRRSTCTAWAIWAGLTYQFGCARAQGFVSPVITHTAPIVERRASVGSEWKPVQCRVLWIVQRLLA